MSNHSIGVGFSCAFVEIKVQMATLAVIQFRLFENYCQYINELTCTNTIEARILALLANRQS